MPAKPIIAITMGDPVGIGPEIIAKALAQEEVSNLCRPLVIGNAAVLQQAADLVGAPLRSTAVSAPEQAGDDNAIVAVLEAGSQEELASLQPGVLSAAAGRVSAEWILTAGRLAMDGEVQAIATAPITKAAVRLGGSQDLDHQTMFRHLSGSAKVLTMLLTKGLRVVHLTTHYSLRAACDQVTQDNVLSTLRLMDTFFTEHGVSSPRIGVAALNPHAGEEGLLGTEEIEVIEPAVADARKEGISATGPVPADSLFTQAIDDRYDVVLAMYHDQGHIAIKVHDWKQSVTMNLGLPFIRTSVDHGTAFDIAGKGIADATGMVNAIRLAAAIGRDGLLPPVDF